MGLWYPYYKPMRATQSAIQVFTSATYANITEMAISVEAGERYSVSGYITFQSTITTTGFTLGFTGPAGSRFMGSIELPSSPNSGYTITTKYPYGNDLTEGIVSTNSIAEANTNYTGIITGILVCGSISGNFQLLSSTSVEASPISVRVGSELILKRFE